MLKYIKISSKYLLVLSMVVLFSACGSDENEGANSVESGEKQFVSATALVDLNDSYMLDVLRNADLNKTNAFGYENAFGYKSVIIAYNTKGQNDEDIIASGLLVIPTISDRYKTSLASVGKSYSVSMICDNHSTIFKNDEAPTSVAQATLYPPSVPMVGLAGFAGIYPDYIGYGASNSVAHPYMLKESSAEASLDMIKASIYYMEENAIAVNYQLYISGYSQGGHAAMALAEEIEDDFDGVDLMGVAAMAGPHNLVTLANIELDASHTMVYPAFLGYLADSYSFYDDDIPLSELVITADTAMYHSLFDGSNTNVEIHTALGLTEQDGFNYYKSDELFEPAFISDYRNNLNTAKEFKEELVENSTHDWAPKTKVNLIHCELDEIIPFSLSQEAYDKFIANGSTDITLTPIPNSAIPAATAQDPFVHSRCGNTAYGVAVQWFDAIRQGNI